MQKGHLLQFSCQECQSPIQFSIFEIEANTQEVECLQCGFLYRFSDERLKRQLRLFQSLCIQIKESEEILSQTSVGIYMGDREVKIPYKLLLTRLNSTLDLMVGDKLLTIRFRVEPISDFPIVVPEISGSFHLT